MDLDKIQEMWQKDAGWMQGAKSEVVLDAL